MTRFFIAPGLAAVLLSGAPAARACSRRECSPIGPALRDGSVVPANVAALPLRPVPASTGPTPTDAVMVVDEAGASLAVTVVPDTVFGTVLVRIDAPLTAGATYHLRSSGRCDVSGRVLPGSVDSAFTVGPSAPPPSTSGAVSFEGEGLVEREVFTSSGACTSRIQAAVGRIRISASPDLAPHAAVVRYDVLVGGRAVTAVAYGQAAPGLPVEIEVYAYCSGGDGHTADGLPAGRHTVEVQAHVAGAVAVPAPAFVEVDLPCAGCGASSCAAARGGRGGFGRLDARALAAAVAALLGRWRARASGRLGGRPNGRLVVLQERSILPGSY